MGKPVVKWVGGKRGILDTLVSAMPVDYGAYYEPFAGGLALYLNLAPLVGHKAYISDLNEDLINLYDVIQKQPDELMARLDEHAASHDEKYYYEVRGCHHLPMGLERAARFVFLNKTGYNGLMRYNAKGEFNTPWGHKKNPVQLYVKQDIIDASYALSKATVRCRSYSQCRPKEGDFVYLDPPYDSSFTAYNAGGFGVGGQVKLAEWCRKLDENGVLFMLSNSNTPLIKELYQGFNIQIVSAPRAVSCKANGRKAVDEVLVRNYA